MEFFDDDLMKLTGMAQNSLDQHRSRGSYDDDNVQSVVNFVARFGLMDIRIEMLANALARQMDIGEVRRKFRKH